MAEQQTNLSEEHSRTVLNNIFDAVFITDDGGDFTFVCDNVKYIFGYEADEFEEKGNVSNFFPGPIFDPEELDREKELANIECVITDKHDRHPAVLDKIGFRAAVEALVHEFSSMSGIEVSASLRDLEEDAIATGKAINLYRILQESLSNAARHSGAENVRVSLSAAAGTLLLEVEDDGAGIPEKTGGERQGLGILGMKERARMCGGEFEIGPGAGGGVLVRVSVPLKNRPGSRHDKDNVAEDHTIVREGLCTLLNSESDMEVVGEASNGLEAIDMVEKLKPDAVVMDFDMPEMDGLEAIRAISASRPDVKILVLTMYDKEEFAMRFINAGASGFPPKSISYRELPLAVRKIVSGSMYIVSKKSTAPAHAGHDTESRADPTSQLSEREFQAFIRLASGKSLQETADELDLAYSSVRTYKNRVIE